MASLRDFTCCTGAMKVKSRSVGIAFKLWPHRGGSVSVSCEGFFCIEVFMNPAIPKLAVGVEKNIAPVMLLLPPLCGQSITPESLLRSNHFSNSDRQCSTIITIYDQNNFNGSNGQLILR